MGAFERQAEDRVIRREKPGEVWRYRHDGVEELLLVVRVAVVETTAFRLYVEHELVVAGQMFTWDVEVHGDLPGMGYERSL